MLNGGIDIGHAINHRAAIKDNRRVAINAVLHRLRQPPGSIFELPAELGIHTLKTRQDQLPGFFRVSGQIFCKGLLQIINRVHYIDGGIRDTTDNLLPRIGKYLNL